MNKEKTSETAEDRKLRLNSAAEKFKKLGITSLERSAEKTALALDWIYRFGFSTPKIIDGIVGSPRGSFASKLVNRGLCVITPTHFGNTRTGQPTSYVTLTDVGVLEAESMLGEPGFAQKPVQYKTAPEKVKTNLLRHNMTGQEVTLKNRLAGKIESFQTDIELLALGKKSTLYKKQPDVAWVLKEKNTETGVVTLMRCAIEVELTGKWEKDLDHFVLACIKSVEPGANGHSEYDRVVIRTGSAAITARYKIAFKPGAEVNIWEQDQKTKKYIITKKIKVNNTIPDKIFILNPDKTVVKK